MIDARSSRDDLMARIDPTVPHSARIWNYWLGGKDYHTADRVAGDKVVATYPGIIEDARRTRAFGTCGISRLLDIGTGLPTSDKSDDGLPPAVNAYCGVARKP